AGNSGAHVRTITIDRTAPTNVTVSYPDGYASSAVTITTNTGPDPDVDASTGVLERQTGTLANDSCSGFGGFSAVTSPDTVASGGGSWTTIASDTTAPYSVSFDTATVSDGLYDLRTVATDAGGNAETSPTPVTNRRVDNTPPDTSIDAQPSDPSNVTSPIFLF